MKQRDLKRCLSVAFILKDHPSSGHLRYPQFRSSQTFDDETKHLHLDVLQSSAVLLPLVNLNVFRCSISFLRRQSPTHGNVYPPSGSSFVSCKSLFMFRLTYPSRDGGCESSIHLRRRNTQTSRDSSWTYISFSKYLRQHHDYLHAVRVSTWSSRKVWSAWRSGFGLRLCCAAKAHRPLRLPLLHRSQLFQGGP